MSIFGSRLKTLRRERMLTQDELAHRLDELGCSTTSKCAISQYENGKRLPEVRTLGIIAGFFGVSVDFLLGNDDYDNYNKNEQKLLSLYRKLSDKEKSMAEAYLSAICDVKAL